MRKMVQRVHSLKKKNIVAYRLLIYILLFSSAITMATISLQLYVDYRNDLELINEKIDQIRESQLSSISLSIWQFDDEQLESQLNGILNIKDIDLKFPVNVSCRHPQ